MYYLTINGEDKEVHAFSMGISPKVNVIVWLDLQLAFYNEAVQYISHYAAGTPSLILALFQTKVFLVNNYKISVAQLCILAVQNLSYYLREAE